MYRLRSPLAGWIAFAVPLGAYVASCRPGVDFWDTGELQTVPFILGIAHPTGFPAYVLLGWVWTHVVTFGDPAWRMNLFSGLSVAVACAALAGAAREWELEPVFGAGAALVFAFTDIVWDHATHAEVHTLALAATACGFWAAFRWARTGSVRALIAAAIAAGLAIAIHSGTILVVPGIIIAAFARRPPAMRIAGLFALGAAVALACYAYLPMRSAIVTRSGLDPTVALGLSGQPFWDDDHPASLAGLRRELSGGDFAATEAIGSLFSPDVLASVPRRFGRRALGSLALGIFVIAAAGVWANARPRTLATLGLGISAALPVLFVLAFPAESDPQRYYLPAFWAIAFFLAAGADVLSRGGLERPTPGVVALIGVLFLFVAGSNVLADRNRFLAPQATPFAQAFVDRVIARTPPNAILVAPWMYATPLAYAAYVQHRLGARILVTGWPGDHASHYLAWSRSRPVTILDDGYDPGLERFRVRDIDPHGGIPRFLTVTGALR